MLTRATDEYSALQVQASQSQSQQQSQSQTMQSPYGRVSPMVSSVVPAPPALSHVRAMGGEAGFAAANGGGGGAEYGGQEGGAGQERSTLWKILTCRCG